MGWVSQIYFYAKQKPGRSANSEVRVRALLKVSFNKNPSTGHHLETAVQVQEIVFTESRFVFTVEKQNCWNQLHFGIYD